ncbi:MAG: hypothetical protein K6F94_09430 [Bacteroidaceae bacterium]|nr:hypothetical protein [Bacteroidaceae bacterium]
MKSIKETVKTYALLLAFAAFCPFGLTAQDEQPTPAPAQTPELTGDQATIRNLNQRITQLETVEKAKQRQIDSLITVIQGLKKDTTSVKKDLRELTKKYNSDSLKGSDKWTKSKALEADKKQLQKEKEAALKQLGEMAAKQKEQHKADSTEIASLNKQLESLKKFRAMRLEQMCSTELQAWLSKKYSEINLQDLLSAYSQYVELSGESPTVANAAKQLAPLVEEMKAYQLSGEVLKRPYTSFDVSEAKKAINAVMQNIPDDVKKEEMQLHYKKLDNFWVTIEIFKKLITDVEKQTNDLDKHNAAIPLVNRVLATETNIKRVEYFNNIPWLAAQWVAYKKQLDTDCIKASSSEPRNTIMNLQP